MLNRWFGISMLIIGATLISPSPTALADGGGVRCPIKCCKNFVGSNCLKCNEECLAANPNGLRLDQLQPKEKKSRAPASAKTGGKKK